MDPNSISQTPFAALTFIAAPAILTNSSSLLANSATLRFLRTREIIREMYARAQRTDLTKEDAELLHAEVARVEIQVSHLLKSLYAIYVGLGSFASATLITLVGASVSIFHPGTESSVFAWAGVALGILGVGGLVVGSAHLITATRVSMENILAEAKRIRQIGAKVIASSMPSTVLDDAEGDAG